MTLPGFYKVSIRLDLLTPLEPTKQGYAQTHTDTLVDLTLVGTTQASALRQAEQHIDVLVSTYAPTTKGGVQ